MKNTTSALRATILDDLKLRDGSHRFFFWPTISFRIWLRDEFGHSFLTFGVGKRSSIFHDVYERSSVLIGLLPQLNIVPIRKYLRSNRN